MSSPKNRGPLAKWKQSDAGWLMLCVIQIYYNKGFTQEGTIGDKFRKHFTEEARISVLGIDPNNNSILNRGHKGQFHKTPKEHPDKHPTGVLMMPYAKKIVEGGLKLGLAEIESTVAEARGGVKKDLFTAASSPLAERREESPGWARFCPEAYREFRDAGTKFEREFRAAGVPEKLIHRLGVAMAIAWAAGQDSIEEISRAEAEE